MHGRRAVPAQLIGKAGWGHAYSPCFGNDLTPPHRSDFARTDKSEIAEQRAPLRCLTAARRSPGDGVSLDIRGGAVGSVGGSVSFVKVSALSEHPFRCVLCQPAPARLPCALRTYMAQRISDPTILCARLARALADTPPCADRTPLSCEATPSCRVPAIASVTTASS